MQFEEQIIEANADVLSTVSSSCDSSDDESSRKPVRKVRQCKDAQGNRQLLSFSTQLDKGDYDKSQWVKVKYLGNVKRVFNAPRDMQGLLIVLKDRFPELTSEIEKEHRVPVISYLDEDKSNVVIENSLELLQAYRYANKVMNDVLQFEVQTMEGPKLTDEQIFHRREEEIQERKTLVRKRPPTVDYASLSLVSPAEMRKQEAMVLDQQQQQQSLVNNQAPQMQPMQFQQNPPMMAQQQQQQQQPPPVSMVNPLLDMQAQSNVQPQALKPSHNSAFPASLLDESLAFDNSNQIKHSDFIDPQDNKYQMNQQIPAHQQQMQAAQNETVVMNQQNLNQTYDYFPVFAPDVVPERQDSTTFHVSQNQAVNMTQEEKDRIFAESLMAEEQKNANNNNNNNNDGGGVSQPNAAKTNDNSQPMNRKKLTMRYSYRVYKPEKSVFKKLGTLLSRDKKKDDVSEQLRLLAVHIDQKKQSCIQSVKRGDVVEFGWELQNTSKIEWDKSCTIRNDWKGPEVFQPITISKQVKSSRIINFKIRLQIPDDFNEPQITINYTFHTPKGKQFGETCTAVANISDLPGGDKNDDAFVSGGFYSKPKELEEAAEHNKEKQEFLYPLAFQLSDQGFGDFDRCLTALQACDGDIKKAKQNLSKVMFEESKQ